MGKFTFNLPDIGEGIAEAEIVAWHVKPGDKIEEDQPIADMMTDEHFQARGLFEQVEINGKPLKIPAIMPRLDKTPGSTEWSGPTLGQHTEDVLSELLNLSDQQIADLNKEGVI